LGVSALEILSRIARCFVHWKCAERSSIIMELDVKKSDMTGLLRSSINWAFPP
jgi:hypothetical protein